MDCVLSLLWNVFVLLLIGGGLWVVWTIFQLPVPPERWRRAVLGVLGLILIIYLIGCLLEFAPLTAPWKWRHR